MSAAAAAGGGGRRSDDLETLKRLTHEVSSQVQTLCASQDQPSVEELETVRKAFVPLKLQLIKFQLVPPFDPNQDGLTDPERSAVLGCARETWEAGAFLSIASKDLDAFWRYVTQVRAYYFELSNLTPSSDHSWVILGLNLMALLAHNRISEFHTLLERIPQLKRQRDYISFPVKLEQFIMEGAYNKVLRGDAQVPHPSYRWFMDMLAESVRTKIMDCASRSYESLSLKDALEMFKVSSEKELRSIAEERNWKIQNDRLCFEQMEKQSLDIPAHAVIQRQLEYATALERIV